MKSSPAPAAVPPTFISNRGELCIVSNGDVFGQELVYDHSTQLEFGVDDFILEDSGFDDPKELAMESCCHDPEVETCYDAAVEDSDYNAELEYCDNNAEDYYCFAEDCYDY